MTVLLAFQVFANLVETLRSSRVTIDDQPMVSSVLRKDNEDLRSRVELQEKELAKSKHTKSMLEQQVCLYILMVYYFVFMTFFVPIKIYFSVFPFRLQFFRTTFVGRSLLCWSCKKSSILNANCRVRRCNEKPALDLCDRFQAR